MPPGMDKHMHIPTSIESDFWKQGDLNVKCKIVLSEYAYDCTDECNTDVDPDEVDETKPNFEL